MPDYLIDIRHIQLLQQLRSGRDNIVVRFLRRKIVLLSMLDPASWPVRELGWFNWKWSLLVCILSFG